MSIATQISRIKGLRNRIKSRLITLGVLSNTNADLSACTTAIESIQGINQQWHMSTVSAIADTYGGDWYLKIPIPTIHITNIKMICLECSPNYSSDNKFIIYIDINHYITASSTTILGRKSQGNAIIDTVNFFMAEDSGTGLNYLYIMISYNISDSYTATYIYVDDEIPSPSRNNTNTL